MTGRAHQGLAGDPVVLMTARRPCAFSARLHNSARR